MWNDAESALAFLSSIKLEVILKIIRLGGKLEEKT